MEIIAGLPEDIAIKCLVRVPYQFHIRLRNVCQSWRVVLSSAHFYQQRLRLGDQCEEGIASLKKYAGKKGYFGVKLVVMGLIDRDSNKSKVLIFDFLIRKWKLGKDIPGYRCFFGCALSPEGLIYIAGGRPHIYSPCCVLREAFVYSVEEDKWSDIPDMNPRHLNPVDLYLWENHNVATFLDGKFFVISFRKINAQVYDTKTRIWTSINSLCGAQISVRNCVAAFGKIYLFDVGNIKEFDLVHNRSTIVGELPLVLNNNRCATVLRDSVFLGPFNNRTSKTVVYYLFQPGLGADQWAATNWKAIDMPARFPTHCFDCSATTVLI